ncbi:MAG: serine/threonine protein kinase [Gammaproteobacteria bacterium]
MAGQDTPRLLKRDLFGEVRLEQSPAGRRVVRDTRGARWWTRRVARMLAAREARSLEAAAGLENVPRLLSWDGRVLERTWLEGLPMQQARPRERTYFRDCLALIRQLHAAGVVHNDCGKEANWLVLADGRPGLIDFQLAWAPRRRGRLFRLLGREDLRHTLKHKRYYCPGALSGRQRSLLERPAWPSRLWMATGKRVYLFVTRRVLGWSDREGASDRQL